MSVPVDLTGGLIGALSLLLGLAGAAKSAAAAPAALLRTVGVPAPPTWPARSRPASGRSRSPG